MSLFYEDVAKQSINYKLTKTQDLPQVSRLRVDLVLAIANSVCC